jgi:hypothetical protein
LAHGWRFAQLVSGQLSSAAPFVPLSSVACGVGKSTGDVHDDTPYGSDRNSEKKKAELSQTTQPDYAPIESAEREGRDQKIAT